MSLQFKFSVHPCILIKLCCLKGGGGRGRPDFTIIFGGGGGQEKSHLRRTKGRGGGGGKGRGNQFFFPLHCGAENRKARSEEVGGHTAQDQKQI